MSRQIQIRRGTAAQHETFIGAEAELTYDTDNKTLRVHDSVTPGGHIVGGGNTLPENIDYVTEWQTPTTENNYTWYRKYASGWVEQGGIIEIGNLNDGAAGGATILLSITMTNSNYYVSVSATSLESYNRLFSNFGARTTSSFSVGVRNIGGATKNIKVNWYICGVGA